MVRRNWREKLPKNSHMRPLGPVLDAQRMSDLVPVHWSGMVITGVGDEVGMGLPLGTGLGTREPSVAYIWREAMAAGGSRGTILGEGMSGRAFSEVPFRLLIVIPVSQTLPSWMSLVALVALVAASKAKRWVLQAERTCLTRMFTT